MANNIVQLQDDSGNDAFPIAGGMAADSITTQMIQDGAVTSQKIDWTTIDLTPYKTSAVSNIGARAIITIKGGIGMITTGGTVITAYGKIFDNIPFSIPFTQELAVNTNSTNTTVRTVIESGTNTGTSAISISSGLSMPSTLYIKGCFITS